MRFCVFFALFFQLLHASPLYLIYLGPPGAGKGTQANLQARTFSLPYISVGALLREQIERESPLGIEAKQYMDRGLLVPDEIALAMLLQRLGQSDCERGALLDGTSRKLSQAEFLIDHLPCDSQIFALYLD